MQKHRNAYFTNLDDSSVDCVKWGLLPQVTGEMRQNCSYVKGRFTGDPSYEYEHTETKRSEERDTDVEHDDETTVSTYLQSSVTDAAKITSKVLYRLTFLGGKLCSIN